MIKRRSILAVAATVAASTVLPAPARAERPRRPTWVRVTGTDDSLSIAVNDVEVERAEVDAAVLRQALISNPGRSEEDLRRELRIYIIAEAHLRFRSVMEIRRSIRFENIGFVAGARAD